MGRRRKYRRFSPEFKAEAVRLVTTTEEPIAKIAQELGVATQNLRAWVQRALQAEGERLGRNRVIRLMRAEQLRGRPQRRFRVTTQTDPAAAPAPNLLKQDFHAVAPNRVWTADITAIPTGEGWLYLAVL